ncbi:MAG: HNH endonuclease [Pirellulaceae bacterium]
MRVITGAGSTDCIVFLWSVTPGGGPGGERPANERRIQITKITGIPLEPGRRTLLGGWSEEAGVWVFWDARRHTRFSSKSPSLQVTLETLEEAHQAGIASYIRPTAQGPEVVVAVAPDSLLWYVQNGAPLHNAEKDATGVSTLVDATPEEERQFLDETENEIQAARRYDLVETMRAYRDAKFRPAVLRAYRYRCAVCQCALKLVDAAHIIPVAYPHSSDEVINGLALCRLHHGAYDNGLLGVQSNYRIVINPDQARHLADLKLDMGIKDFRSHLPEKITLPSSIEVRPNPEKLIVGLRARRWPASLVA